jgi:hypothetical protein
VSKPCKICISSNRLAIDRELVKGGNMSEISRRFGLSYATVCHHREYHLSRQLAKSQEVKELSMAATVAKDVSQIYRRLNRLLDDAEAKNSTSTFLSIAAEIRSYSEFLLRLQATFERIAAEEKDDRPADGLLLDLAPVSDEVLKEVLVKLSAARTAEDKPIPALPIRGTLH